MSAVKHAGDQHVGSVFALPPVESGLATRNQLVCIYSTFCGQVILYVYGVCCMKCACCCCPVLLQTNGGAGAESRACWSVVDLSPRQDRASANRTSVSGGDKAGVCVCMRVYRICVYVCMHANVYYLDVCWVVAFMYAYCM